MPGISKRLLVGLCVALLSSAGRAAIVVNLYAAEPAVTDSSTTPLVLSSSGPVTLSGFDAGDVLNISLFDNRGAGGYAAWNAWGADSYPDVGVFQCNDPLGCKTVSEEGSTFSGYVGWINRFFVLPNGSNTPYQFGDSKVYPTPEDALDAFVPGTITGYAAYTFFIWDSPTAYTDNRGGLSIRVAVPEPGTLTLVALGLAGFGAVRKAGRAKLELNPGRARSGVSKPLRHAPGSRSLQVVPSRATDPAAT